MSELHTVSDSPDALDSRDPRDNSATVGSQETIVMAEPDTDPDLDIDIDQDDPTPTRGAARQAWRWVARR